MTFHEFKEIHMQTLFERLEAAGIPAKNYTVPYLENLCLENDISIEIEPATVEIQVYADYAGYVTLGVNIEGQPVTLKVSEDGCEDDHNAMIYEGQTGKLSVCIPVELHNPNED